MKIRLSITLGLVLICQGSPLWAQEAAALLPNAPSVTLLPDDTLASFHLEGKEQGKIDLKSVDSTQPAFKTAWRAQTTVPLGLPYDAQLTAPITAAVAKGDVLFASFWARATGPQDGASLGFTFEKAGAPYTRSFGAENNIGKEWRQFNFPFKAVENYQPGEANFHFRLGYGYQTVEIGGISLRDYGANFDIKALPVTVPTYEGREPDAPWRKAALERIEKIRKADFHILVQDKNGKPVKNAEVVITQTRQAFAFGSAVDAKTLLADTPDSQIYAEKVKQLFNKVVLENDLKWPQWEKDRDMPQRAIKQLSDEGIAVRGHNLIWPSWGRMPADVGNLKNDPAALQKRINDHITEEVSALRDQLAEWDVINEPYSNHDVTDTLGPEVQVDWYNQAHTADPVPRLFLNDFSILEAGGRDELHQQNFEEHIAYLLDHHAPLGGIGIQGHFDSTLTPPEKMLTILDRYAKFKIPIQITEFDVNLSDEQLQADYTRDFLIAMFSRPEVMGVVTWGFWEGRHWIPSAAMWRKDWSIKPNGQVWMDLVKKAWMTNADLQTDKKGVVSERGFLGDYTITVNVGGQSVSQTASLKVAGENQDVTLTLP